MKIYIPPQVKRLLLFLPFIILLFIIFRRLVIPDTFGDLGHYRAASLEDYKAREVNYAGHELCGYCHDDIAASLASDLHSTLACEGCHGPGQKHVDDPEAHNIGLTPDRAFCALCHAKLPARNPEVITQIDPAGHNPDKNCIECHNPHMPLDISE
jgi:hypothetical protein